MFTPLHHHVHHRVIFSQCNVEEIWLHELSCSRGVSATSTKYQILHWILWYWQSGAVWENLYVFRILITLTATLLLQVFYCSCSTAHVGLNCLWIMSWVKSWAVPNPETMILLLLPRSLLHLSFFRLNRGCVLISCLLQSHVNEKIYGLKTRHLTHNVFIGLFLYPGGGDTKVITVKVRELKTRFRSEKDVGCG